MKNIIKSTLLLLVGGLMFTSCDKDMEHNPVLQSPESFVLNAPSYANAGVDLSSSDKLNFTWSQPDYGFPAAASYEVQISSKNIWTISQAQADADKTGQTIATYGTVGTPSRTTYTDVPAAAMAKLLQQMERYAENMVPSLQEVYVRVMSVLGTDTVYSNVQKIVVRPYYVELRDADPVIYYLIGNCIGNAGWSNSQDGIGVSMIPMFTIAGETYDKVTGKGKIEYAGYFPDNSEFKIIFTPGNWDYGICGNGQDLGTTVRNGGNDPGNILIANAGYYHILVNTVDNSCVITKMTDMPTEYRSMLMAGNFNGWTNTTPMAKFTTHSAAHPNHDWVHNLSVAENGECKFVTSIIDGNWGDNWGSKDFPFGTGVAGGSNIPYKAGNYQVFFNDILKSYSFVAK